MIDGKIAGVKEEGNDSGESFKLILGRMRRQKLLEHIENKNFMNDLLVPYEKLNQQNKPGDEIDPENKINFKKIDY